MRTAAVKYSYFYDGNPRVGQIKAVSGGERAVNGSGGKALGFSKP